MSKLSALRGNTGSPTEAFSTEVDKSIGDVFSRMQGIRTPTNGGSKFPPKKLYVPSRFRCAANETKRMVVIDEKFTFGMQEHSLQDWSNGGKWTTERCISAWDTCPLCTQDNVNTYDVVLLTVLDLTPWTTKEGKEVEFTKRVLACKKNDLTAFTGLMGVHGSLRGIVLDMTRGGDKKESACGKPTFVQKLSEEDLVEAFGSEALISEKGNVIRPENDTIAPFNYEKCFPVPSRMELARKFGIAPRPGSQEEEVQNDDISNEEVTLTLLDLTEELPDVD